MTTEEQLPEALKRVSSAKGRQMAYEITTHDDGVDAYGGTMTGLVLEIHKENIDKPPTNENEEYIDYIKGIGKIKDRLIILLDLTKILEY